MSPERFEALGRMSVTSACMEIIRELDEGDGIATGVALEEVRARTERPEVELSALQSGMRQASERLMDDGIPGVFRVRGSGWQRMKPTDVVQYMRDRGKRAAKQVAREHRTVDVVDVERLGWQDKETVRVVSEARRRQIELADRRKLRKRPMRAVDGEHAG